MKPVLTPAEAAALDDASERRGLSVAQLMENAGSAVARAAIRLTGGAYGRRATVVCGKGNNGGDGLVAARWLSRRGMRATVVLLDGADGLREPSAENLRRAEAAGVRVLTSAAGLTAELQRADVAVDALFGTGFRGSPAAPHAGAISALNSSSAPVVAVDIPSGVDGGTGAIEGDAVDAELTVTFGALKPGLVLYPGASRAGSVEIADIGFPADLVSGHVAVVEDGDVALLLPRRAPDAHKRASGHVLVVGGSRGMAGAVRLMAMSAYRAGAGLVSVAAPESIIPVLQAGLVEAVFLLLPETDAGTAARTSVQTVESRLAEVGAVALGPGMTTHPETAALIREVVRTSPAPVVLDADGITAFAGGMEGLADRNSEVVVTPHLGEFGRLVGRSADEVGSDRIAEARRVAREASAHVLLKGTSTVVADPRGEVRITTTGSPALATAGTGDVLTGLIAALLAGGLAPFDAAAAGAFIHGRAGALAAASTGNGTIASDVAGAIPRAMRATADHS